MKKFPVMEIHISKRSRDFYGFDQSLFALKGNVIIPNFHAARTFAQAINKKRDLVKFPEKAVKPGQINAMGLIDEILHFVITVYREEIDEKTMEQACQALSEKFGKGPLEKTLWYFTDEFPPLSVYQEHLTPEEYLGGSTEGVPNRLIVLEEMLLLWLANMNPAYAPFSEFFNDQNLKQNTPYLEIIADLKDFFDGRPGFGPFNQNLIEMLRSPAVISPNSLPGQLKYIRENWGYLLRKHLLRLISGIDLLKEEEKITFLGPGKAQVYQYTGLESEPENFTPDKEWMPRLVLLAKNIYVWLYQLSRKYGRTISKLYDIPDEELQNLRRRGFTGLWLIGVWERSTASREIKVLCGNPEAVSSAYSLFDYQIAADLGGEDAHNNFRDRAWKYGIRLASDMVPNHMGIYSRWTIEHPDWFINLSHRPYPWYAFNGPDLSRDDRISIHIEDHYYTKTDAAVVFRRTDRLTGSQTYVYHGNDGTSMPWNDTAQLNYLNSEVREAMINTIVHVAKKFPVIRFDAAMTLTKRHYQRLWFPEPGAGGAIPTRSEFGLSKDAFNRLMPHEFWREVVDRIAREAPDTLLLAEAFWLLEGYFVRTLGMHRVYNSAFMNMLRDEDNAKYRTVIKNTIEFDREILRRFVNFMNNPDERTAVDQFGKNDKYFGICAMMVTMPGLPMFGHGQIEGYTEKYGMEYRRAYYDESPDEYLVGRHEHEIFPLLHKRHLFQGVENFLLYDFYTPEGNVNEDVFAYSNMHNGERGLVIYHNRYASARGWIKISAAFAVKSGQTGNTSLVCKSLSEGLQLKSADGYFTLFKDHITNLEYIRENRGLHENGLYLELGAYNYHVFIDFREIRDNEQGHYGRLCAHLNGRGVPDIQGAMKEVYLQPIHQRFSEIVNGHMFQRIVDSSQNILGRKTSYGTDQFPSDIINQIEEKMLQLFFEIRHHTGGTGDPVSLAREIRFLCAAILLLPSYPSSLSSYNAPEYIDADSYLEQAISDDGATMYGLCGWLSCCLLGNIAADGIQGTQYSRSWIDEWSLERILEDAFLQSGLDYSDINRSLSFIRLLVSHQNWYISNEDTGTYGLFLPIVQDTEIQQFLQVNRYRDILWFSKEAFELLLSWLFVIAAVKIIAKGLPENSSGSSSILRLFNIVRTLLNAAAASGYQLEEFIGKIQSTNQPQ